MGDLFFTGIPELKCRLLSDSFPNEACCVPNLWNDTVQAPTSSLTGHQFHYSNVNIFSPHSIGNCNFHIEGRMQHESQKHVTSNKRTRTHSSDITYLLHKNSCNQQKRHSNQDTCDCTWKRCFCAWFQFFSGVLPILPDSTLLSNMKDTTVALISSPNAFVSYLCPMHCVFSSVKPSLVQRGLKRSFAPHLRACARST